MQDWVPTLSWNEINGNVKEFRTLMLKYCNEQKYQTAVIEHIIF